jgi:hypothetical protein
MGIAAGIKEKMIEALAAFQMEAEELDLKINRNKSRSLTVRMGKT